MTAAESAFALFKPIEHPTNSYTYTPYYYPTGSYGYYNSIQPIENSWQHTEPAETLRYNPFDDKWSYEGKGSNLRYNPFENTWDYTE